jgi:tartrate-resistant acid phosphatase type 5
MSPLPLSRRDILRAVPALAATIAAPRVFAQARAPRIGFLALGDWGRGGHFHQRDVAAQMEFEAMRIGSRFTATTGDNFYLCGVNSIRDSHWDHSFRNVYGRRLLDQDWFAALGNHDYCGNPDAQIEYSASEHDNGWHMPSRYYAIRGAPKGYPDVDLFFLDTQALVHKYRRNVCPEIAANLAFEDPTDQIAWLRRQLYTSTARWKFVFGHHPVYSDGAHGDTPELQFLRDLFADHRISAYVCGHDHNLQHFRQGGIDYVVTGAGSAVSRLAEPGRRLGGCATSGFASFVVEGDICKLRFVDRRGRCVHRAVLAGADPPPVRRNVCPAPVAPVPATPLS